MFFSLLFGIDIFEWTWVIDKWLSKISQTILLLSQTSSCLVSNYNLSAQSVTTSPTISIICRLQHTQPSCLCNLQTVLCYYVLAAPTISNVTATLCGGQMVFNSLHAELCLIELSVLRSLLLLTTACYVAVHGAGIILVLHPIAMPSWMLHWPQI